MKKLCLLFTILFVNLTFIMAQNPFFSVIGQFFEQGYGDSLDEVAHDIYVDFMGKKAMTGWVQIFENNKDVAFWFIDSLGKCLLDTNYGFNINDEANSIAPHSTNGWVLAGYTEIYTNPPMRTGETRKDILVIRIDTTGDTLWTYTFGREGYDEIAWSVVNNGNDDFVILAGSTPTGEGDAEFRLLKISDGDGSVYWNNLYGISNYDIEAYKMIMDNNGNYIIAANDITDDINPMIYVIEDQLGRELTSYSYDLNDDSRIFSIDTAFDNGYMVAGYAISDNDTDGFVMKLDSAFSQDWRKQIGQVGLESFNDIVTTDFSYIAVGSCNTRGEGLEDMYVVHLDSFGDTILHETFGGDSVDFGFATARFPGMPFVYFAGYNTSYGIEESGNAYLGGVIYKTFAPVLNNEECFVARALFVDQFINIDRDPNNEVENGSIVNPKLILGNSTNENLLINFAILNNIQYFALYDVNWIFEDININKKTEYLDYLNTFISKCIQNNILCSMISEYDFSVFNSAHLYNINASASQYNYSKEGKIQFFLLEHEFWHAAGMNGAPSIASEMDDFFIQQFDNHKDYLESLYRFRDNSDSKDSNILVIHDYIKYFYHEWDDDENGYNYTIVNSREEKAQ